MVMSVEERERLAQQAMIEEARRDRVADMTPAPAPAAPRDPGELLYARSRERNGMAWAELPAQTRDAWRAAASFLQHEMRMAKTPGALRFSRPPGRVEAHGARVGAVAAVLMETELGELLGGRALAGLAESILAAADAGF